MNILYRKLTLEDLDIFVEILISSMYTNPSYRRMGIAKILLDKVVTAAKNYGCNTVWVTASEMGTYLYKDYGFSTNDRFLIYNF